MQGVVHTVEIVEETGHGRDFDDLAFIVVPAQAREQFVVDPLRIDRELLRVCECRFLGIAERACLKVEQLRELILARSVPRSLRGV